MPEEISASTESATPVDSGADNATATAASSPSATLDAGEQAQVSTTPDATASAPSDSQIDAGWSLEDEPQQPVMPENDDDLQALTSDPQLDQTRVPGLVEAVRSARQQVRSLTRDIAQMRQQPTLTKEDSGTLELFNGLIGSPAEGALPFMQRLAKEALPAYTQIADLLVRYDSDYLVSKLQEAGSLPNVPQYANSIDPEDLSKIPENLRSVAKTLPPNVFNDLMAQPAEVRDYNLERELKLQQMDATQRQQAETQWKGQVSQAQQQGQESVTSLAGQYENAHYSQLSKWQPFGPDQPQENQMIYSSIVEGAFARLLNDPKFLQMNKDARSMLENAPMRRLRGEEMAAKQDEQRARGLAAQFNTRLGQLIKEQVQKLDAVFKDARAYRESQRQEVPNRTEISGSGGVLNSSGAPPTLLNGKTNPAYLDWLAASLPKSAGEHGLLHLVEPGELLVEPVVGLAVRRVGSEGGVHGH